MQEEGKTLAPLHSINGKKNCKIKVKNDGNQYWQIDSEDMFNGLVGRTRGVSR